MEELTFRNTLRAAQQGDGRAFGELYLLVSPRIRGFLHARGADDPEALTNEVMLKTFKSLSSFRGSQQAFVGWVFQIARNTLLDEVRKRDRRVTTIASDHREFPDGGEQPIDEWHEALEDVARVQQLLDHLSQDQADVVTMRAIAGLSYEEIAAVTGKRVTAVRATYSRGRAALRSLLELDAIRRGRPDSGSPGSEGHSCGV